MQQLIRRRPDQSRYSRGDVPNATYRNHGTHTEAIEIVFNPDETTYRVCSSFSSRSTIRRRRGGCARLAAVRARRPAPEPEFVTLASCVQSLQIDGWSGRGNHSNPKKGEHPVAHRISVAVRT